MGLGLVFHLLKQLLALANNGSQMTQSALTCSIGQALMMLRRVTPLSVNLQV